MTCKFILLKPGEEKATMIRQYIGFDLDCKFDDEALLDASATLLLKLNEGGQQRDSMLC
jgi:hypothetical protein